MNRLDLLRSLVNTTIVNRTGVVLSVAEQYVTVSVSNGQVVAPRPGFVLAEGDTVILSNGSIIGTAKKENIPTYYA